MATFFSPVSRPRLIVLWSFVTGILVTSPVLQADAPAASLPATSQPLLPPPASQPFRLDPAKYMGIPQIKPGMRGIGRSVFSGTEIKEFNVEVISVLPKFAPKMDMILIRCSGAGLEHSGIIAGMSGSPIYLPDPNDGNKLKMIGALAYGWSFNKDPIAGVQPIAQMLSVPDPGEARPSLRLAENHSSGKTPYPAIGGGPDTFCSAPARSPLGLLEARLTRSGVVRNLNPAKRLRHDQQMQPLATPLMVSGANQEMMSLITQRFGEIGLVPIQAGGGSAPASRPAAEVKIEPGAVLAVPLLTGDVEFTAIGTVTEVQGDKVWGFGHAMFAAGKTALPLGTGMIHVVMSQLEISFKMGSLLQEVGTLYVDEETAVVSRFGKPPAPVPMSVSVSNDTGRQTYHYNSVQHEMLTPRVAGFVTSMSLMAHRNLPPEYTVQYDIKMTFDNGRSVRLADFDGSGFGGEEMMYQTMGVVHMLTNNEFARCKLTDLSADITVLPQWHYADLLSARALRTKLRPGQPLEVSLTLKPVRGEPYSKVISIPLPADLPEGSHQVYLVSSRAAVEEELSDQPALGHPKNVRELFDLVNKLTAYRSDRLYARVRLPEAGLSLPGANLPAVPVSRSALLKGGEHSNILPYNRAVVTPVDMGTTVAGSMTFEVKIDKNAPQ